MPALPRLRRLAPVVAVLLLAADLQAQLVSTSHHRKDKPPYYHGDGPRPEARIAWTPITTPAMRAFATRGGDAPSGEMQALLDTLNARLALMMAGSPRVADERLPRLVDGAPQVTFGCEPEFGGEAVRTGRYYHAAGCKELEKDEQPSNELAVTGGTKDWRKRAAEEIAGDSATHLLLLTLRVGEQYPWSSFRGKGIRLGTGYDVSMPFISAVDRPVTVVQLVGTIVNREGKPVRSGAEGLVAAKPGALVTVLGGQQAVSDRQIVELLLATRRTELPGEPLAWEVALRTLVAELTNRDPAALAGR